MPEPTRKTRGQRAAELAERRAEMWRMRVTGHTQQQIATYYGISQQAVSEQLRRSFAERPATAIDEYRAVELDKLDRAERAVLAVMSRPHYVVSAGKIVTIPDPAGGEDAKEVPLIDDGPILAAVGRLVQISQHRADLTGMKAPVRVSLEAQVLADEISSMLGVMFDQDPAEDDSGCADGRP